MPLAKGRKKPGASSPWETQIALSKKLCLVAAAGRDGDEVCFSRSPLRAQRGKEWKKTLYPQG